MYWKRFVFVSWIIIVGLPYVSAQDYPNNNGILVLDSNGSTVGFYPTPDMPNDVALFPSGDRFAAATKSGVVIVFQQDGTVVSRQQFVGINDIDILADGNEWLLTSRPARQVVFYDRANNKQRIVPFAFAGPTDADLLPNGNLLVADAQASRVIEITQGGELIWEYSQGLAQCMDAIRLPDGQTLISDFDNHRLISVNPQNEIIFDQRGFDHPIKIHLDSLGRILIADGDHQRFVELQLNGDRRILRDRLNYVQSIVEMPSKSFYLCAIQNRFLPQGQVAAMQSQPIEEKSIALKIIGLVVNRYVFLLLAWLLWGYARAFGAGRESTQLAMLASWLIVFAVGYSAVTEAASQKPYIPGFLFWLVILSIAIFSFPDAKRTLYPNTKWRPPNRDFVFPFGVSLWLVVLPLSILALGAQYYHHAGKWMGIPVAWYIPMLLWLAAIYLLLRPFFQTEPKSTASRQELKFGQWSLAVPFSTGSVSIDDFEETRHATDQLEREDAPYFQSWANTTVLIVIVLGFLFYSIHATSIPTDVHGDEAEVALHGIDVRDSWNWNFFNLGWYQIPNFFFLVPAWVMWIFGDNLFGMRMTGALLGTAAIPVFYLLARRILFPVPASVATFLFAISTFFLHFSRMGTGYTQATLLTVAVLYFLVKGIQESCPRSFCLAGLCSGLGMVSYQAAHILMPLVFFTITCLFLFRIFSYTTALKSAVVFGISFWVMVSPLVGIYLHDPFAVGSRARSVSIFAEDGRIMIRKDYPRDYDFKAILRGQILRSSLAPITYQDESPYLINTHHGGMLDPIPALGFMAGTLLFAMLLFRTPAWMLLSWTVIILFVGSALTNNAPAYQRLAGLYPILILIATPSLYGAFQQVQRWFRWSISVREIIMACCFVVLLGLTYNRYFHQIMSVPQYLDQSTRVARFLQERGTHAYTYMFGMPYFSIHYGNIRFMAPDAMGRDVEYPDVFLKQTVHRQGTVIFLLVGRNRTYLNHLREQYPGGREETYTDRNGQNPFVVYEVNL